MPVPNAIATTPQDGKESLWDIVPIPVPKATATTRQDGMESFMRHRANASSKCNYHNPAGWHGILMRHCSNPVPNAPQDVMESLWDIVPILLQMKSPQPTRQSRWTSHYLDDKALTPRRRQHLENFGGTGTCVLFWFLCFGKFGNTKRQDNIKPLWDLRI